MKKNVFYIKYGNQLHIGKHNGDDTEHCSSEETDYPDVIQTSWDVAGT